VTSTLSRPGRRRGSADFAREAKAITVNCALGLDAAELADRRSTVTSTSSPTLREPARSLRPAALHQEVVPRMHEPSCRRLKVFADTCHLFEEAVTSIGGHRFGNLAINVAINVVANPC